MKTLFILNEAPYGSERTYNGARLAGALAKQEGHEAKLFLMGDGAAAAHVKQKVPAGFYNLEVMLGNVVRHNGVIGVCGTCMDARGLREEEMIDGARRGTLAQLADAFPQAGAHVRVMPNLAARINKSPVILAESGLGAEARAATLSPARACTWPRRYQA